MVFRAAGAVLVAFLAAFLAAFLGGLAGCAAARLFSRSILNAVEGGFIAYTLNTNKIKA